jgi:hypothetical protein
VKPHVWVRDPKAPWNTLGTTWFYCSGCDDHCAVEDPPRLPTPEDLMASDVAEDCDEHAVWNVMED